MKNMGQGNKRGKKWGGPKFKQKITPKNEKRTMESPKRKKKSN
jgi:hypothetical protein